MGAKPAYLAAGLHGRHHLRARHAGNTEQLNLVNVNRAQDCSGGIVLQIAVDNSVFLTAFQHSRKRKHRKRKPAVARLGGSGVEEDDHFVALAV